MKSVMTTQGLAGHLTQLLGITQKNIVRLSLTLGVGQIPTVELTCYPEQGSSDESLVTQKFKIELIEKEDEDVQTNPS